MPEEIINYLIAGLLWPNKEPPQLAEIYRPFIDYIKRYDSVTIFSLNHDIILETIFRFLGINYCDGFSEKGSNLKYQEKSLPRFIDDFSSENIRLVKLHGSVDMYAYEHGIERGATLTLDGQYTYFKPGGFYEKHHAVRVDPVTGEQIQGINRSIVPKFITGKNKLTYIESDYMYSKIYRMYQEEIRSGNDLLIIGYSYRDVHINQELKNLDNNEAQTIINLNYGDTFPFKATNVTEIRGFSQLSMM
jgi:hypothetical protein